MKPGTVLHRIVGTNPVLYTILHPARDGTLGRADPGERFALLHPAGDGTLLEGRTVMVVGAHPDPDWHLYRYVVSLGSPTQVGWTYVDKFFPAEP